MASLSLSVILSKKKIVRGCHNSVRLWIEAKEEKISVMLRHAKTLIDEELSRCGEV
jgi:hypothetical protein